MDIRPRRKMREESNTEDKRNEEEIWTVGQGGETT